MYFYKKKIMEKEKINLLQPKKIKLDYSQIHFRGVFATEDIESGEIIERCPLVNLDFRGKYHGDPQIWNYVYTNKCDCKECERHGPNLYMVLGYGMLYNHSDTPNTIWDFDYPNLIGDVVSQMPIKKGEEITVSYGDAYFNKREKVQITENNEIIKKPIETPCLERISVNQEIDLPSEWLGWVIENFERGVDPEKIKSILIENNFQKEEVEKIFIKGQR